MTFEICDRCGKEIVGDKAKLTIDLDVEYPKFYSPKFFRLKELCPYCAKRVLSMLDNMLEGLMEAQEDEEELDD